MAHPSSGGCEQKLVSPCVQSSLRARPGVPEEACFDAAVNVTIMCGFVSVYVCGRCCVALLRCDGLIRVWVIDLKCCVCLILPLKCCSCV